MTHCATSSSIQVSCIKLRFLFPNLCAALALAALLAASIAARAQAAPSAPDAAAQNASSPAAAPQSAASPAAAPAKPDLALSNKKAPKVRKQKEEKDVVSKDTKKADKKDKKINPIEAQDAKLPDKQLYDKAMYAVKHGHYDVARLDLQTLLNTYPDSQYMMRAKLGVADSWFQEGGPAALTQAEQEYTDFITFFPNSPEAAEAQMRVGDIYFRQMDKPNRDYSNIVKAEAAYRQVLQQFPYSTLVPRAKQRLREVQETLASRESDIASFYAARQNWSAAIARYQTVVDTYPLYSRLDDVLIGLGDAFEAEARGVRASRLPEAGKARLEKIDDDQAYAAYGKVVLEHSAAPHVEDARDRIAGMGFPMPAPTPEQVAASAALENSRGQYTLSKRATLFFLHQADTVPAATTGEPPLDDAPPTLAPTVYRKSLSDFYAAMNPAANPPRTSAGVAPLIPSTPDAAAAAPAPAASAAPLALQDVANASAGADSNSSAVVTSVQQASPAPASTGNSMGIEIVQPSSNSPAPPATAPASPPVFPGSESPAPAQPAPVAASAQPSDNMGGIQSVAPAIPAVLPPIEKPAAAPDAINDAVPGAQPPAQIAPADGKTPKPPLDKANDSSSKHKKKKGLSKLNPF
jgi:outer membrane protein assembly factor BamD